MHNLGNIENRICIKSLLINTMYTKIFYNPTFLFLMLCFIVCNPVDAGLHFIVQNFVIAATVALVVYQKATTDPLAITIALVVLGCHRIAILLAIVFVVAQSLRDILIRPTTIKPTMSEPMVIDKSVPNIDLSKLLCDNMLHSVINPTKIDQILKAPAVNNVIGQMLKSPTVHNAVDQLLTAPDVNCILDQLAQEEPRDEIASN